MAMDLGGAQGGVKSDINVTPLVDVMLVLLIILILVAPLAQSGASLTLPQAGNTGDKPDTQQQTVVAVTADRKFYVDNKAVGPGRLLVAVEESLQSKPERIVYLKADSAAPYAAVMEIMDTLRQAQIEQVALITDPLEDEQESGGE